MVHAVEFSENFAVDDNGDVRPVEDFKDDLQNIIEVPDKPEIIRAVAISSPELTQTEQDPEEARIKQAQEAWDDYLDREWDKLGDKDRAIVATVNRLGERPADYVAPVTMRARGAIHVAALQEKIDKALADVQDPDEARKIEAEIRARDRAHRERQMRVDGPAPRRHGHHL